MEAKDTILTAKQIDEVEKEYNYEEWATHRVVNAYLKAQAELSFKAGIHEVVEWLMKEIIIVMADGVLFIRQDQTLVKGKWQAKLKEWGIATRKEE